MTDVKLIKDCGLYPSYKKIIDFTGTKSQIITKQISWINTFTHRDEYDVNYNKFQNKLVMPIDYEEALTYTYCVLSNITGTDNKPQFFFVNDVENLTNGIDNAEPNVAFYLSLDPIMTYMGDWRIDECMVDREHKDRWSLNSSTPLRLTPNIEGVTANSIAGVKTTIKSTYGTLDCAYICIAFTSNSLEERIHTSSEELNPVDRLYYAIFPVYLSDGHEFDNFVGVFGKGEFGVDPAQGGYVAHACKYPSLGQVLEGSFLDGFAIPTSDIVSISILPIIPWTVNEVYLSGSIVINFEYITSEYNDNYRSATIRKATTISENYGIYFGDNPGYHLTINATPVAQASYSGKFTRVITSVDMDDWKSGISPEPSIAYMMQIFDAEDLKESTMTLYGQISVPEKPLNEPNADKKYEPALYMEPYISRYITDGKGQPYLQIPDYLALSNWVYRLSVPCIKLHYKQLMDASNCSMLFYINDDPQTAGLLGASCVIPNQNLYVVNDAWKDYSLTQKDSDRNMTINYAIKNAVDNLIYMSYGGTLVGSRSMGKEGLWNPAHIIPKHREQRSNPRKGTSWEVDIPDTYVPGSLTATGRRVVGATGLAAGASIVTSLVDAHTAWANQMEKEKMVKNKPSGLLMGGTGQSLLEDKYPYPVISETKVDDIAMERAYENFRKYGYFVNKFEKPNLQSRKYFNYILTNGAIINGAINQSIRDTIASIFDAGVTIFHYDSGDTTTRNLEYTDKENVEVSLL